MITQDAVQKMREQLVSLGPAAAAHNLISDWRFTTTPVMDNSAPSAYTDRATLAAGVSYAEMGAAVLGLLRVLPDSPMEYAASNKAEVGLIALRIFNRAEHQSPDDIKAFSEIFAKTTRDLICLADGGNPWLYTSVPWMREVLETNLDLLPASSFAQFVHDSPDFNRFYGHIDAYLDRRSFIPGPNLEDQKSLVANQGIKAVVNGCFGLSKDQQISIGDASSDVVAVSRLSRILQDLEKAKVVIPAYQLDLAVTAQLIDIMLKASEKAEPDTAGEIESGIVSLVAMTTSKKLGSIRENAFRPGYTAKPLKFWAVSDALEGIAETLIQSISSYDYQHRGKGLQAALNRFISKVASNAFQALDCVIPSLSKPDGLRGSSAYFRVGVELMPGMDKSNAIGKLFAASDKDRKAELIASIRSEDARLRLIKQNPAVKGAVLMSDLGF